MLIVLAPKPVVQLFVALSVAITLAITTTGCKACWNRMRDPPPDGTEATVAAPSVDASAPDATAPETFGDLVLHGLTMIDGRVGWALDFSGGVLRTEDGAEHFIRTEHVPEADDDSLQIAVVDRATAWVIDRSRQHAFHTSNAGASWEARTMPESGTGADIAVFDDEHVWLSVENVRGRALSTQDVFTTDDGGRHWKQRARLEVLSKVPVVPRAARAAWAAGRVNGEDNLLLRTLDEGWTWKEIALPVPASLAKPRLKMRPRGAPAFWGPNRASGAVVALAETRHSAPIYVEISAVVLYLTSDGGATWRASSPHALSIDDVTTVAAASEHGGIVFYSDSNDAGPRAECRVVRANADGEWSEVGGMICPGYEDTVQLPTAEDVFMQHNFYPPGETPTEIMASHDGGKTWNRARALLSPPPPR